jgi:uncharacterized pyridoxamine 5'-phosphate oxidase family protein
MKALLAGHHLGVLATSKNDQPHCSLMTYVTGDDGLSIFLLTLKDTRKFANLLENPRVSFLVDTRTDPSQTPVRALTVSATYEPDKNGPDQDYYKQFLVDVAPHLRPLAEHPQAEIVRLRVQSFLLLEGALDAQYLEVTR